MTARRLTGDSLSLSLTHTHTHTHSLARSLSLSRSLALSLSFPLSLARARALSLSLSLCLPLPLAPLARSLSRSLARWYRLAHTSCWTMHVIIRMLLMIIITIMQARSVRVYPLASTLCLATHRIQWSRYWALIS